MPRGRPTIPAPPLWARWVLAIAVAAAVIAGIVIATNRAGPDGATSEAGAEAEINRLADITITEDEAPHFASLAATSAPSSALERAIESNVRQRIVGHQLTGPLQSVRCKADGRASSGRHPYRCTVRSDGISYPFAAVVDEHSRRLAWCKIDPKPAAAAGPEIPISASCRT
ncbi:MAG TPA: hypothetical protein VH081_05405 [Solirubrobacteraceae bacterium]|jgi:hypothetical protein|nr:hypothetical protein [Solirubrobacteraceae bacterium]